MRYLIGKMLINKYMIYEYRIGSTNIPEDIEPLSQNLTNYHGRHTEPVTIATTALYHKLNFITNYFDFIFLFYMRAEQFPVKLS